MNVKRQPKREGRKPENQVQKNICDVDEVEKCKKKNKKKTSR